MVEGRGERQRRRLLDATLEVIGTQGTAAVSHRSVAAAAQAPLGSTTYYFSSKQDILTQAMRYAAHTEIESLEDQVRRLQPARMSPPQVVDALLTWLDNQLRGSARHRLVALYSLQLEAVHQPDLREIYQEWTTATVRLARRLLEDARASGPDTTAPLLVAALDGLRHNQLAVCDEGLSHATARPLVELLVHQVALGRSSG